MSTRYQKQIVLPEVGLDGQKKLKQASVLCVGLGGLGSPCVLYLAAAGIGRLGLVDDDAVEISNLQRQILYASDQSGLAKSECAANRLKALNPECEIEAHACRVTHENVLGLMQDYDVIIDATDNFNSRFLINDAAVKLGKPVVYGAIQGFEGQASIFWASNGPCYRCLFPAPPKSSIMNCAQAGVLGPVAGMIGTVQALETIKLLLASQSPDLVPLLGKLWIVDTRTLATFTVTISKRADCPACSKPKAEIDLPQCMPVPEIAVEEIVANATFIDVREMEERQQGHIPDSLHLPLSQLERGGDLPVLQPKKFYIIYCQHGVRSLYAVELLRKRGELNVKSLKGGYDAWLR